MITLIKIYYFSNWSNKNLGNSENIDSQMIKEEESFFMKDKKLSDSSYEPIRDLSHLSPYH